MRSRRFTGALLAGAFLALPAAAQPQASATTTDYDPLPHLVPGDAGDEVLRLQAELAAARFYVHEIDGVFGRETAAAVVAFHKYLGTTRTDEFSVIDWHLLRNLHNIRDPGLPDRGNARDYIEVDITRQLLFIVRDGEVLGILPVSTGSGQLYWSARSGRQVQASTPRGDFALRWRQTGWACDSVTGWCVYKYWAFTTFYGIHGYRSVPTTPASHGCVRLHLWDSDWIEQHLFVGMNVHIWDEPPVTTSGGRGVIERRRARL